MPVLASWEDQKAKLLRKVEVEHQKFLLIKESKDSEIKDLKRKLTQTV